MKRIFLFAGFWLSYFVLSGCDPTPDAKLSESANCFTVDFFKKMGTERKSLVSSPVSAYILLSILRDGARGKTAEELTNALRYQNFSVEEMREAFYTKLSTMKSADSNTLDIANSVWIKDGLQVQQSFTDAVTNQFLSQVYNVNFLGDARGVTQRINDWANSSTHGMISKLFDEVLSPSTVAVLANAIFFNGTWMSKFKTDNTRRGNFFNNDSPDGASSVDMMYQKSRFNYKYDPTLKAQVLQMFYVGKNSSMVFILPDNSSNIGSLESAFTCDTLKGGLENLKSTTVEVTIPKFDIASKFNLVDSIKAVGIVNAFQDDADFSGIARGVKISEAIQKCVIKVFEAGSQAAVVTGMTMVKMSMGGSITDPEIFNANHPFHFMIYDHRSNLILFMGRVNELPNLN